MDLSKYTDEELQQIAFKKPKDLSSYSDEQLEKIVSKNSKDYDWSNLPRQLAKASAESLPLVGGAVGGFLGTSLGPVGTVVGGGMGAAAGKSLENIIESNFMGEDKTTGQIFKEPAISFVEGAAGELGGQLLGKGLSKVAEYAGPKVFGTAAERMAARAIGAERGSIKKIGADKIQQVGRYALDENLLTPFSNTDDVIAANLANKQRGGKIMGDVYESIDSANASTFNPLDVAVDVESSLGGFYRSPLNKGVANQLDNTIEAITIRGDKAIPIKEAQVLKEELGRAANWKNNLVISEKEQMARDAYAIVNKSIDDAVEAGSKAIGTDDILYNLKKGKELYSNSQTANDLLQNKFAREQGNKIVGLTDWAVLGGGTTIPATAGMYGTKKYGERFAAQQAALLLDKISKAAVKSPLMNNLSKTNPTLFNQFVSRISQSGFSNLTDKSEKQEIDKTNKNHIIEKVKGSKYAQVLENAAAKGDSSFNAANYILSQRDENYRQLLNDDEK